MTMTLVLLVATIAGSVGYLFGVFVTRWALGDRGYDEGWNDCLHALSWTAGNGNRVERRRSWRDSWRRHAGVGS